MFHSWKLKNTGKKNRHNPEKHRQLQISLHTSESAQPITLHWFAIWKPTLKKWFLCATKSKAMFGPTASSARGTRWNPPPYSIPTSIIQMKRKKYKSRKQFQTKIRGKFIPSIPQGSLWKTWSQGKARPLLYRGFGRHRFQLLLVSERRSWTAHKQT